MNENFRRASKPMTPDAIDRLCERIAKLTPSRTQSADNSDAM